MVRGPLSVYQPSYLPIDFIYEFNFGANISNIDLRTSICFSVKSFLLYARLSQCLVSFKEPLAILTNLRLSGNLPRPAPSAIFAPILSPARTSCLPLTTDYEPKIQKSGHRWPLSLNPFHPAVVRLLQRPLLHQTPRQRLRD